ncbi:hypothetical protein N476_13840 [Pseudoalteromonas luteoviolacea H33]|uniref:Uncharacterized protein n=1 Tax=Pseudoalteromonas luteoviolacea H33 TaxID=1365251 RepID=A0A161Y796_9GAMM|nr:hypothetical protein N476_13840 [Pseudoalteromonas luteoviolacea H33]
MGILIIFTQYYVTEQAQFDLSNDFMLFKSSAIGTAF